MKLVDIQKRQVVDLPDSVIPAFALLSHTWTAESSTSNQWVNDCTVQGRRLPVHEKVIRAFEIAMNMGIDYLWVDSLCIDTSSTTDLEECVNGASCRLRRSTVCFAYLDDLPADGTPFDDEDICNWAKCRYWTRAWTLQEMVLPSRVEFFDQKWNYRGSKTTPELLALLPNITGVPSKVLLDSDKLDVISLAVRISWFASRTSRREEDIAYSLAPIVGVTMHVRYGEGGKCAFLRLQEEILQDTRDGSIFAWRCEHQQPIRGLLARSPSEFRHFYGASELVDHEPWKFDGRVRFSSKGVRVQSHICNQQSSTVLDIGQHPTSGERFGIYIREWNSIYVRINPAVEIRIPRMRNARKVDIARDVDSRTSTQIHASWSHTHSNHNSSVGQIHDLPWRLTRACQLSATYDSKSGSSLAITANRPSGIKRSRSGWPFHTILDLRNHSPHPLRDYRATEDNRMLSPESEVGDNLSSNKDNPTDTQDSEDDGSRSGDGSVDENNLEAGDGLDNYGQDLLDFSYDKLRAWVISAHYTEPPNDNLPARKRAKTKRWQSNSVYLKEEEDEEDSEFVVVSHIDGYFHLACPFYVSNPGRYRQCLMEHDLQTIEDVINHLRQHHSEPQYCPMCRQTFTKITDRDEHVRVRMCQFRNFGEIGGINEHQKMRLTKKDRLYLGEKKRWLRIWSTVFPNAEPCESLYYENGVERSVSLARDYWAQQGDYCVSQYLTSRGKSHKHLPEDKRRINALCRGLLADLLNKVYHEHECDLQAD